METPADLLPKRPETDKQRIDDARVIRIGPVDPRDGLTGRRSWTLTRLVGDNRCVGGYTKEISGNEIVKSFGAFPERRRTHFGEEGPPSKGGDTSWCEFVEEVQHRDYTFGYGSHGDLSGRFVVMHNRVESVCGRNSYKDNGQIFHCMANTVSLGVDVSLRLYFENPPVTASHLLLCIAPIMSKHTTLGAGRPWLYIYNHEPRDDERNNPAFETDLRSLITDSGKLEVALPIDVKPFLRPGRPLRAELRWRGGYDYSSAVATQSMEAICGMGFFVS